jgi:hypothetical protein
MTSETEHSNSPRGRGDAENIAIQVFNFIVTDVDRIIKFLNLTGLQPETIRESAKSALFLLGVLDYASKDEELLKVIENEIGIRPAAILVAAVHLAPEKEGEASAVEKKVDRGQSLPRRNLFQ